MKLKQYKNKIQRIHKHKQYQQREKGLVESNGKLTQREIFT